MLGNLDFILQAEQTIEEFKQNDEDTVLFQRENSGYLGVWIWEN